MLDVQIFNRIKKINFEKIIMAILHNYDRI